MATSGRIWFVSNTNPVGSNDAAGDDPVRPLRTLANALTKVRANRGDYIVILPGHAETITTALTLSTAGVTIIGLGVGQSRPVFTSSGAIDLVNVTAADCRIENVRLVGAASCTAHLNIAAAGLQVENCIFTHPAAPTESVTIASGADRFSFNNCHWVGTADGPDACLFFEVGSSSITNWQVTNCTFRYTPNGLDNAVFLATADAAPGGVILNCVAIGLDATALFVDFNSSVSVGEGLIYNSVWQHRAAATIANGLDLGGYGTAYVGGSDGANRAAELLPATSAS
jgi:hypothetical protein